MATNQINLRSYQPHLAGTQPIMLGDTDRLALREAWEGLSQFEIARKLGIRQTQVKYLFDKLRQFFGVETYAEAIAAAAKEHFFDPPKARKGKTQLAKIELLIVDRLFIGERHMEIAQALDLSVEAVWERIYRLRSIFKVENTPELLVALDKRGLNRMRNHPQFLERADALKQLAAEKPPIVLSRREAQLLDTYRQWPHLRVADIAKKLGISRNSAMVYSSHLFEKFDVGGRNELLRQAKTVRYIVQNLREYTGPRRPLMPQTRKLGKREMAVLRLMNQNFNNVEIAKRCNFTILVTQTYVFRLRLYFAARTRYETVQRARETGIIQKPKRGGMASMSIGVKQRKVLMEARKDLTPAQIAERINATPNQVHSLLTTLRKKFKTTTHLETVDAAIGAEVLSVESPSHSRNKLTELECAILREFEDGYSQREIGENLGISKSEVSNRLMFLRAKFRTNSNEEALEAAEQLGLYHRKHHPRRVRRAPVEALRRERRTISLTSRQAEILEAFCTWPQKNLTELASHFDVTRNTMCAYSALLIKYFGVTRRAHLPEKVQEMGYTVRLPPPRFSRKRR